MAAAEFPHSLELVIDFVNTLDIDAHTDELATAEGLGAWMAQRGLLNAASVRLQESDRRRAVSLREALREQMLAHDGSGCDEPAAAELDEVARRGALGVRFSADGSAPLTPGAEGFAGALAQLLVPVAEGTRDGSWRRVKACRADDCQWAFYDRSRNRSGVWCDMAVCGNRAKVRAHRLRGSAAS